MPVGKNSIKRVSNNGYSQVNTSAPDMENSTVIANISPEVFEMVAPKKTAPKKSARKPASKKPTPPKKEEPPPPVSNNIDSEVEEDCGFITFTLGDDLPYYLL